MALEEEYERKRLHFETILTKRRAITQNKYDHGVEPLILDDVDGRDGMQRQNQRTGLNTAMNTNITTPRQTNEAEEKSNRVMSMLNTWQTSHKYDQKTGQLEIEAEIKDQQMDDAQKRIDDMQRLINRLSDENYRLKEEKNHI